MDDDMSKVGLWEKGETRMSNSGIYIDSEKAEAIDEEYLKKCKEINELKKKNTPMAAVIVGHNNAVNTDVGDCPKCGRGPLRACDADYCPGCGQKLKWK